MGDGEHALTSRAPTNVDSATLRRMLIGGPYQAHWETHCGRSEHWYLLCVPTTLYLITGLPGAGKSTRAAAIIAATGAEHVDMDEAMRARGLSIVDYEARFALQPEIEELIPPLLRAGRSVVAEFGSWSREERDRIRALSAGTDARTELHWLDAPVGTCVERVLARGGEGAETLADLLRTAAAGYEQPTWDEVEQYDAYFAPDQPWL